MKKRYSRLKKRDILDLYSSTNVAAMLTDEEKRRKASGNPLKFQKRVVRISSLVLNHRCSPFNPESGLIGDSFAAGC